MALDFNFNFPILMGVAGPVFSTLRRVCSGIGYCHCIVDTSRLRWSQSTFAALNREHVTYLASLWILPEPLRPVLPPSRQQIR